MPHLITGLILSGLGLWGIINWWNLFGLVMRGVVPFFLLVFGLVAILASTRRLARSLQPEPMQPPQQPDAQPGVADAA